MPGEGRWQREMFQGEGKSQAMRLGVVGGVRERVKGEKSWTQSKRGNHDS